MKKTLSIHLGRQLFIIEEDAYQRLQTYLERLEHSFQNEEGNADIIEDIEMRFAELLLNYLGETRKVVDLKDIENAVRSLGEPEVISDETINENTQYEQAKNTQSSENRGEKRLYRDTQDGMLGGVCTGFGNYLNIDPVLTRILFVIFGFMGFGVVLYIILWVIIPNASTPAERLQMKGKPVNIDTIKEEFERATGRIKSDVGNAANRFRNSSDHIAQRARGVVGFIGKLIGTGIIVFSLIWLFIFTLVVTGIIDVFPTTGDQEYASLHEFLKLVIPVNKSFSLVWTGILLVGFLSPLFGLLAGSRMIIGKSNRFFKINFIVLPVLISIGIFCGIVGGIQSARDYAVYAESENEHLTVNAPQLIVEELPIYANNKRIMSSGGIDFITIEHGRIIEEGVHIKYRTSNDSLFHIYQSVSANGVDRSSALKRNAHIQNQIRLEGNKLLINPYFSYPSKDGMRRQEVEIIIEKPQGKKLRIKGYETYESNRDQNGMFYSNEDFESWDD